MELIIKINMDNAAFEDKEEIYRLLDVVKYQIKNNITTQKLYDINGNKCGTSELIE